MNIHKFSPFLKVFSLYLFFFLFSFCTKKKGIPLPAETKTQVVCDTPSFSSQIMPILQQNCVGCHPSGNPNGDMTSYAGVYQKIQGSNPFRVRVLESPNNPMPPGGPLPSAQLRIIDCWLKAGAPNN